MRRPGLLLLICLLTLRMWIGDAMAFASVPPMPSLLQVPSLTSMGTTAHTPSPCHGSQAQAPGKRSDLTKQDQVGEHSTHHQDCLACQVCHLSLLALTSRACTDAALPQAVYVAPSVRFQSAHLAPGLKPPIA